MSERDRALAGILVSKVTEITDRPRALMIMTGLTTHVITREEAVEALDGCGLSCTADELVTEVERCLTTSPS